MKIIERKQIDDFLYKLLCDDNDFNYIVRHYKIIKRNDFNINNKYELSQKVSNNNNVFYGDYKEISNKYLYDPNFITFEGLHEESKEIFDIINNTEKKAYDNYTHDILIESFTEEEIENLKTVILKYINNESNNFYIRLGIKEEEKKKFIIELLNTKLSDFFDYLNDNELTEEEQNKMLNDTVNNFNLLPMYNHNIFYPQSKYEYFEGLESTKVKDLLELQDEEYNKNIKDL